MLDWLISGGQISDGDINGANQDELSPHPEDAPETPAPIFAVRAFKQAIWGTPKPGDTAKRPLPPRRRTSSKDASATTDSNITKQDLKGTIPQETTPLNSPAKRPGILLTPGTAGKGRKTVSFDAQQRALQFKLAATAHAKPQCTPNDETGEFPSPWGPNERPHVVSAAAASAVPKDVHAPLFSKSEAIPEASRQNTAAETKGSAVKPAKENEDIENYAEPCSASGRYWKSMHEAYARKSELQMRKLVKKEQIAKKFAKFKDAEACKRGEELGKERKRVEELEAKLADYVRRLEAAVAIAGGSPQESSWRPHSVKDDEIRDRATIEAVSKVKNETSQPNRREESHQAARRRRNSGLQPERSLLDVPEAHLSPKPHVRNESVAIIHEHVSSDIWANIGNPVALEADSPASSYEVSNRRGGRPARRTSNSSKVFTRGEREALRPTVGNTMKPNLLRGENAEIVLAKQISAAAVETGNSRADRMSNERREAAKKRLEERKRVKAKVSS